MYMKKNDLFNKKSNANFTSSIFSSAKQNSQCQTYLNHFTSHYNLYCHLCKNNCKYNIYLTNIIMTIFFLF